MRPRACVRSSNNATVSIAVLHTHTLIHTYDRQWASRIISRCSLHHPTSYFFGVLARNEEKTTAAPLQERLADRSPDQNASLVLYSPDHPKRHPRRALTAPCGPVRKERVGTRERTLKSICA